MRGHSARGQLLGRGDAKEEEQGRRGRGLGKASGRVAIKEDKLGGQEGSKDKMMHSTGRGCKWEGGMGDRDEVRITGQALGLGPIPKPEFDLDFLKPEPNT